MLIDVPQLYFAFIGVVVAAFTVDLVVRSKRTQDRFQDYRALAEGLRVQFYWRLAGIHESVYEQYLARQEGELDWIRNAMRAALFHRQAEPEVNGSSVRTRAMVEIVLAQWIRDQARISRGRCTESDRRRTGSRGGKRMSVVSAIIALLLAVVAAEHTNNQRGILVMLLTFALAGAGLFTGYAQKRAHEEHARRYGRMYSLYRIAGDRIALLLREDDVAAARGVLIILGREALAETCDWLLLHREREIDVPTG